MIKEKSVEDDELMPDWERNYLYRVEAYLVHKYMPELVEEFRVSFARARIRREEVLVQTDHIFKSAEELFNRIGSDLQTHVTWKPKATHRATSPQRPGISEGYQRQFEEL